MSGKYGLMVHYLIPNLWSIDGIRYRNPEAVVDAFDLDVFMGNFDATGAEWLIFTIGQNTGFYCSPNATLDRLAGPGHCTKRDLLMEIATAVKARGKRFIAYLPCEVYGNKTLHEPLVWDTTPGSLQKEFQQRYTDVIKEWSLRLGRCGWASCWMAGGSMVILTLTRFQQRVTIGRCGWQLCAPAILRQ